MQSLTRVLLILAIALTVKHGAFAAEPAASASAAIAAQIDQQVESKLAAEGIRPAELTDDSEFLRRLYLDLHGVVPTREQADRFLADSQSDKRARLIDELLASPRYGQYMADVWQGYLMSPLADDQRGRADRLRQWLAGQFNTRTWDQIAAALIGATGKMEENPAVTYLIEGRNPRIVADLTDLTSRYFLGVRLNCAQCHDHPTVKWKQQDFWGLAAFFAPMQTPRRAKQVYELGIIDDPKVSLKTLKDAGMTDGFVPSAPTFLGGAALPAGQPTNRAALAKWATSSENPFFARAMANRTWWRLFGRGIVHPVDDMHEANLPTHPQLLDLLTRHFIESNFDLKSLTRAIVSSRAYQRTSRPGDATEKQAELFGRMAIKVVSAGQLYDSLETIFGQPAKVTGIDVRQDAARPEFTEFFGETGDPDPTAYRRGIPHLLRLMNSGQFAGRAPATSAAPNQDVATDLFLTILSRRPTADEATRVESYLARSGSADARRELAWVLIMTSEFSLNH
jgi:hypothetical protein